MHYNCLEYLLKFKGYDESHNQWEAHTQVHAKPKTWIDNLACVLNNISISIPHNKTTISFIGKIGDMDWAATTPLLQHGLSLGQPSRMLHVYLLVERSVPLTMLDFCGHSHENNIHHGNLQ
jgi:hypothetical protein